MTLWSGEQAGASPDDVVDDNWVRGQQQSCEALGNLRKLQPGTIKNLEEREVALLCLNKHNYSSRAFHSGKAVRSQEQG